MIARNYINNAIPHLKLSDSVDKAINWMEEYKVSHLPVVEDHKFLGIIQEEPLLEADDYSLTIKKFAHHFLTVSIRGTDHIFDAIKLTEEHKLSVIAVVDEESGYEGIITLADIMRFFSGLSSFRSPGAIIVLYMKANDYSLSQISRIIENNGAKILSSYVIAGDDPNKLHLCLKLNRQEIAAITAALERFEYNITARFTEVKVKETNQDNLDQLFKYLDI